jgi:hypothetical protein
MTPPAMPRHSTMLERKAVSPPPPAVVVAQNLLMRKLGLSSLSAAQNEDFEHYIKVFADNILIWNV